MMMFVTYPDGTRELHDQGLVVRLAQGRVVAAALILGEGLAPVALDVALGDPRSTGYVWQKRVQKKWTDQLLGRAPFDTDNGPVFLPAASGVPLAATAS